MMPDKIFMIDATSPFFSKHAKVPVNWSKAPLDLLEKKGRYHPGTFKSIKKLMEDYLDQAAAMGYNAVSFDDLAHIVPMKFYSVALKEKIKLYRKGFRKLFALARNRGMKVFITTDFMFFNSAIKVLTGRSFSRVLKLFGKYVTKLFKTVPEADGIILRFGESDGLDVTGEFQSRVLIKSAHSANLVLKFLIPLFEEQHKLLIFRTWTTGGHAIGDLLWNPATYHTLTAGISSSAFIISLKYGCADFFRYLELSPHFKAKGQRKMIELQARREYEGFGEFPSFVGFDYEEIYQKLKDDAELTGIMVWCQTGGWSRFENYTFLKKTSFWNELNTFVTVQIFRYQKTASESAVLFYQKFKRKSRVNDSETKKWLEFLVLAEKVMKNLYYDPAFAKGSYYFNRIRIPPLLHILWDHVTITNLVMQTCKAFADPAVDSVRLGESCIQDLVRMRKIAVKLDLPYQSAFQYDTFELLLYCRKLIYGKEPAKDYQSIKRLLFKYKKNHPDGYHFHILIQKWRFTLLVRFLLRLLIRKRPRYRLLDKLLYNRLTSGIMLVLYRLLRRNFPLVAGKQGMPVTTFLK